ncbi:MAG: hypothetical protein PHC28_12380, partial [Flavobacterium sp.]|uniref:virginiamycin B lyase family protein n=1 Tax=Flavobacterium sp. TaxID=239 RepID=UPI00262CC568
MNKKSMTKIGGILFAVIFLFIFILFFVYAIRADTQVVESTTGSLSSIALDNNDFVHISYYNSTIPKYCNNTAGTWSCVNLPYNTLETYDDIELAIDSNDKIHICYSSDEILSYCNNTAGTWSCEEIFSGLIYNRECSIAIDTNNRVHIITQNGEDPDITISYCNNTAGTWSCEDVDIAPEKGRTEYIALDSNNKAHILHYYDAVDSNLRYCNNTAGTWSCVSVSIVKSIIYAASIAIDGDDIVHISYYNNTNLVYCNNTAGTWSCEDVETTNDIGRYSSIAIDKNNKVHISHFDATNNALRYCNNTAGTWSCVKLIDADTQALGAPGGRGLAIKKGRIVDSVSFSNVIHMSWNNISDLMYTNATISSGDTTPKINLDLINPENLDGINATQNSFFNVTVNVSCENANCGEINVSLDPQVSTPFVWVIDHDPGNVTLFDLSGNKLGIYSAGCYYPSGVAIDLSNNAWVSCGLGYLVTKLNSTGSILGTYNIGHNNFGIAVDSSNNTWVVGTTSVTKLNSTGSILGTFTVGNNPLGIAVDSSDNIWITHYLSNYVTKLNSTGSILGTFTVEDSSKPKGIAVDSSGNVWVTSSDKKNVTKLNSTGSILGIYNIDDVSMGIAIDSSDNIWITVNSGNVTKLNSTGSILGTYNLDSIITPYGVSIDSSNNVWVADYASINVTKLNSTGSILGTYSTEGQHHFLGDMTGFALQHFVLGYTSSKGLISTSPTTPFYTNESNPRNVTLNAGESQVITFWVNATGAIGNAYYFFAFANQTSDMSISNITGNWNVTIISGEEEDTTPPLILFISPTNTTYSYENISVNISSDSTKSSIWYFNGTANVSYSEVHNLTLA